MKDRTIILASKSSARSSLLHAAGYHIIIHPTHTDEKIRFQDPVRCAEDIADQKMDSLLQDIPQPEYPVITVDTLIYFDGRFIGKASTRTEAGNMLYSFSGNTHIVYSGATIYLPDTKKRVSLSNSAVITFHDLSKREIDDYLSIGEWKGAAGCYRIQHQGIRLINTIDGDYFTVVGLPLLQIFGILRGQSY